MWPVILVWAVASTAAAAGLLAVQPLTGVSMEILSLVMLAPGIGTAICWVTMRKHLPDFPKPAPTRAFALAIGLSIAVTAVYFAAVSLFRGQAPQIPATVAGTPVAIMILAQALGALTEEIGFRGILFHALGVRLSRFATAVIVGAAFGVWHVQYFALPLVQHAAFFVGTVTLTVTMAYVMTGSLWQRMVVCTIIHLGANLALAFTGGQTIPMTAFGLALVVGCLIALPLSRVCERASSRR